MKASNILTSNWRNVRFGHCGLGLRGLSIATLGLVSSGWTVATASPVSASSSAAPAAAAIAQPAENLYAQMPNSYANLPPVPSGQQYVVLVNGNNPDVLARVRSVEPGAFQTNYDGRSVIQAGRYSYYQNAQQQQNVLSSMGVGAEIAEVAPRTPSYAELPAAPVTSYTTTDQLPPLPVVAVPQGSVSSGTAVAQGLPPQNVEFGQVPNFNTSPGGAVNTPPPELSNAAVAAPVSSVSAPYYVVIPTSRNDLPNVSSRVIQLGAPADRVQQRTEPFGPNVAVGPFSDRGLAQQWSNYFRDAGYGSSRVHYEP